MEIRLDRWNLEVELSLWDSYRLSPYHCVCLAHGVIWMINGKKLDETTITFCPQTVGWCYCQDRHVCVEKRPWFLRVRSAQTLLSKVVPPSTALLNSHNTCYRTSIILQLTTTPISGSPFKSGKSALLRDCGCLPLLHPSRTNSWQKFWVRRSALGAIKPDMLERQGS